jgi:tripartite-type tricarboxylate transporter receptor subunit TctC
MTMKKLLSLLLLVPMLAFAWQPTKPITVIFPNGPGAGNEISFRIVAKIVEEKNPSFKWAPDYKPGADGNIGMTHFNTLPADGYHVAMPSCQSTFVTAEIWYPDTVKFDAMAWEGVANIGKSPLAFYARTSTTIDTPQTLIAEVRSGKRPITFAVGGAAHKLAVEYFVAGVKPTKDTVETILYKGPAQAMQDVLGGHVEFGVFPIAVGAPMVQAGKIKLIGLASEVKMPGLGTVPLMKDYIPGLNVYACWNLMLPKGTPPDIQQWYKENFVPAIRSNEVKEQFDKNFIFITPEEHSTEGIRASMTRLRQQWQPFARKIKPE